mmetsp:Transcript_44767/g.130358  ORF Transcript_44767/g.130358 Transcript_44767/m.130358 type:complete len:206 (-) Transcript_44767:45-662(-)
MSEPAPKRKRCNMPRKFGLETMTMRVPPAGGGIRGSMTSIGGGAIGCCGMGKGGCSPKRPLIGGGGGASPNPMARAMRTIIACMGHGWSTGTDIVTDSRWSQLPSVQVVRTLLRCMPYSSETIFVCSSWVLWWKSPSSSRNQADLVTIDSEGPCFTMTELRNWPFACAARQRVTVAPSTCGAIANQLGGRLRDVRAGITKGAHFS